MHVRPNNLVGVGGTFAEDIVVERVGPGRYRATLDHGWDLVAVPQGGIIVSFGLRAAMAELGDPLQQLRTCTSVFAGQVAAGELDIDVTVLRSGRSATQMVTTVKNAGEPAGTTTLAVFGGLRKGPTFVDVSPPEVARPLDCPAYGEGVPEDYTVHFVQFPFWERVEGRSALGHPSWEDYVPTGSDTGTWLRFIDAPRSKDGALDPLAVLTLADRMPGSIGEYLGPNREPYFAPSADLTVHLFEPATTEWILAHDRARWADDGWASAQTTLWSEDGTLIAYATQMMLFTYMNR
ncbi:MAG: thioesterase family protein [Acidimicrobiales bacterium]